MKTLNIVVLMALLGLLATASVAVALEQEGGLHFVVGAPAGEFGDTVKDPGFGLALHYGLRPQPALTFGIGLDILIYGSETRPIRLPLVDDFDISTTNNLADGFLFAQWRPLTGALQPYAEARFGVHYLWTESVLEDQDWWDDGEVARETNYEDSTSFWGAGGGLLIRLREGGDYGVSPGVFLDLKATYLQGGEAEYLAEGDIDIVNDVPVYNPSKSETSLVLYELGIVMTF